MRSSLLILYFSVFALHTIAQTVSGKHPVRKDSLVEQQHQERTVYDINYYHLSICIDPDRQYLSGQNLFRFTTTRNCSNLQFDLFENMKIEKILYKNVEIPFTRESDIVHVTFPETIKEKTQSEFTVFYSGKPVVAKNAPWDGGFVFKKDATGKPWIGVAVQGIGASLWWPNKDQQIDKVDSMMISIAVPDTLMNISNGQYRGKVLLQNGYARYDWFVSYPINTYNVTVNIGDYTHIRNSYAGKKGNLDVNYYILKENVAKAKKHLDKNVQGMLDCFEHWFGPYPFYRDGYKLIETSYLGMEHQSAIAYGNQYKNGYLGMDNSGTGFGKSWDFIIIHESAHEWFGNNVTAGDIGDSWIHEGFATYAEAIFIECREGKEAAATYIAGLRHNIKNDRPMVDRYSEREPITNDIYYKGANVLQTIRTVINSDEKWHRILQGITTQFSSQSVTTTDIIEYINKTADQDLTSVFYGYLHHAAIPVLAFRKRDGGTEYRWDVAEKGFDLPVRIKFRDKKDWQFIHPTHQWTKLDRSEKFIVDTTTMYFSTHVD